MAGRTVQRLDRSWKGLEQIVRPDDDPDNIANHFSIDKKACGFKYAHHMMTLGAFRNERNLIELNYVHYTESSPSLDEALYEYLMMGFFPMVVVKIHKAVIKEKTRNGEVVGMTLERDEGEQLKEWRNGNICRVQNDSYPKEHGGKLKAVKRVFKRCGHKSYSVALNNCEHLVTELLTGTAESFQAECRIGTALAIDSIFQIPNGAIKLLLKQLPKHMMKLGTSEAPMLRSEFVDLFASGLDDSVEYLIRGISTTGTEFRQIVSRSKLNFASAAIVELCFLVVRTIYDIYAYKWGKLSARLVAQNFLQGFFGLVGTSLGTFFGGLLGALLFAPLGLSAGGLIAGNIAGGVVGSIIIRKFGTKWLKNGKIERHLAMTIERKYKFFPKKGLHRHSDLLQKLYSLLSPHSVCPMLLKKQYRC